MSKDDDRLELRLTLEDCRKAVQSLERALKDPTVLEGMDPERARILALHLNGAVGLVKEAVEASPAGKLSALFDKQKTKPDQPRRRLSLVKDEPPPEG